MSGTGKSRVVAVLYTDLFSVRETLRNIKGLVFGRTPAWVEVIEDAGLPATVTERIHLIVARTRLWTRERIDVARELCAHAADAVDAGREPAEVAESLGNPRVVARLLRRSMKRKRPLPWQIRMWTLRGLGITASAVLLTAGFMAGRFYIGSPTIKRNFIAELNAPLDAIDEDKKAWGLIREAWATLAPLHYSAGEAMQDRASTYEIAYGDTDAFNEAWKTTGIELLPIVPVDHPDAEAVRGVYLQLADELELLQQAAERPRLGLMFTSKWEEIPEEIIGTESARGWIGDPIPESNDPEDQDWVVGVLLPALGPVRVSAQWMGYDALAKIAGGDTDGAVDSIRAMLGLAEQVERDQFLIGYIVGIATEDIARKVLAEMLTRHRDALERDHLVQFAHMLGQPRFERIPLEGERMMLDDFLQRAYTDDGNGDGTFTNEGLELLGFLDMLNAQITDGIPDGIAESAKAMLHIARMGSRAEQRRMADRVYAQLQREADAGYGIYRDVPMASNTMIEMLDEHKYAPLRYLLPALGSVTLKKQERRARVEACLVGIASELYRRDTGAWPTSVAELCPAYLPFVPEDPVTGDPLSIAPGETSIVVYTFGPDGDDDRGTMDPRDEVHYLPKPPPTWFDESAGRVIMGEPWPVTADTPDGDWVLFPVR